MPTKPIRIVVALALIACGAPETSSSPPAAPASPKLAASAPPKMYQHTEPAPTGAALRVFVEPDRLVGWVAGPRSQSGATALVAIDGKEHAVKIDDNNTFELAFAVSKRSEAIVRVGALTQIVTVEPPPKVEPAAFFVVERSAYRPAQKLSFAAFLRKPDNAGEYRAVSGAKVEVKIISQTKKATAATLSRVSDADGRITGEYTFSVADPLDAYAISIDGYRGKAIVALSEFRKPKVKLEVDAAIADRTAKLKFRALDFLDAPVAGGDVSFKAQIVRDSQTAEKHDGIDPAAFAYAAPPATELSREDRLRFKAKPETTGRAGSAAQVIGEHAGKVDLDARGSGVFEIPVKSELLRGRHRLLVDAVIVDANGQEQRVMRSIPLSRSDVRLELAAPTELALAGMPLAIDVRVVDKSGKVVVPKSASIAAIRIADPVEQYIGYYGNNYLNAYDNNLNGTPNGGVSLSVRPCMYTAMGCRHFDVASSVAPTSDPIETLATSVAVDGPKAELTLDDAGAYRLVANARLADGSSVWSELGIAVREADTTPPLVIQLDRDTARQGERITGQLQSRYRNATALVVVRDAHGIRTRKRVALVNGIARLDIVADAKLGFAATVEAMLLDAGGKIYATQELVRVLPTRRELAIRTTAKSTYAPGEMAELEIAVDQREPVDLVVAVYDQAVLAVAPDRAVDPGSFFFADDRLRARAGLATLRAELGDVTIGRLEARAHDIVAKKKKMAVEDAERGEAQRVIDIVASSYLDIGSLIALLRFAGVQTTTTAYSSWNTHIDKVRLRQMRLADLFANEAKTLGLQRVIDTLVISEPGGRHVTNVGQDIYYAGYASGNAVHSVGGNMSFSAPSTPSPMQIDGSANGDVVRRDFSDSAFWTITRTDAAGKARVSFKLPDSITNWQVVVTAIARPGARDGLQVGRDVTKLRTVRDVMIWPMLPRQFTEGDVVSIFGTVHNHGDADRAITVKLEVNAELVDIVTPASVIVNVPRGKSLPVRWSVRAKSHGMASLLMRASANDDNTAADASLKRIPIRTSAAEQVVTVSGFADKPLSLALPPDIDPKRATLELTFAPSLAADMVDTLDYLVEYPYGCAEQTMSRFAPAIRVAGILDNLGIKNHRLKEKLPGVVEAGVKRLAELQQADGGWGWNGHASTHEMITPYVVWGLLEAERAGHRLPDARMIERGLSRVRSLMTASQNLSDRVYLAYVYSHRHSIDAAVWKSIVESRDRLSDYALALALEIAVMRKDTTTADAMTTALHARASKSGGTHWNTGAFSRWMDDPFETTAVVLKALVAHDANDALIPDVIAYFVSTKRGDRWNSTKDTAMILYAMTDVLGRKSGLSPTGGAFVEYAVDGKPSQRLSFADGLTRKISIDGAKLGASTRITFPKASPGMMARAVLRFHKAGRDLKPAADGLDVARHVYLLDAKGARVRELATNDRVPRGAYIESAVTVAHEQKQAMQFLLVEDPKPAGAEALRVDDPRFPRVPAPWVLREDRESHLAFHHERVPATTMTRTFLHLEMSGELVVAPAQAELMYQTQTRGHSGSFVLRVD